MLDWQAIARRSAHQTQIGILEQLAESPGPMSPSDLRDALDPTPGEEGGLQLGVVSYHVRLLASRELIVLVGTEPRRGALKHNYALADGIKIKSPRRKRLAAA